MSSSLTINVPNLAGVMSIYDRIKVYSTTTLDSNGAPTGFTEVTDAATRIILVANSATYVFVDPAGTSSTWYTISYFHSTTLAESSQSAPTQGSSAEAFSVLTVEELKSIFLFGIDLTDDLGTPYPDALFSLYIQSAYQHVKDKLDIDIVAKSYTDEAHDFYKQDYNKYIWMKMKHVPIQSVERVQLVLPTNQQIIDYDLSWVHLDKEGGQIEIVPGSGQVTLGQTGAFLPLVFGGQDYLPQAFRVSYTSGFAEGQIPANIKEVIGMLASFGPLGIAGDLLVGAGIASQSLSIDGLSQTVNTTSSATNSGYGARLVQYQKQLKDMWPVLYNRYHPRNMVVC